MPVQKWFYFYEIYMKVLELLFTQFSRFKHFLDTVSLVHHYIMCFSHRCVSTVTFYWLYNTIFQSIPLGNFILKLQSFVRMYYSLHLVKLNRKLYDKFIALSVSMLFNIFFLNFQFERFFSLEYFRSQIEVYIRFLCIPR